MDPHAGSDDDDDAGAAGAAPRRFERGTSNVNVPTFDSLKDDFEEWVVLFEKAVMLATNAREEATLHFLYKEWLLLKLDKAARATHAKVAALDWPELKAELARLLVDPQEKARWQAKKTTIKWDGKESFHSLASRVKRAVDKYERGMPDEFKQREYYQRFKNAFKKSMRRIIAVNCPENDRTIDKAVEIALRYHIALTEDDDDGDGDADEKAVTFAAGAFQPDRATGLENALAKMTTQMENMSVTLRGQDIRFRSMEDRLTAIERGNPFGGRDSYRDSYRGRGDSRNRDSYRDAYRGRGDSRNRDPSRRCEDNRDKPRLRGGHAPQSRSPSDDDIDMDMDDDMDMDSYRDSYRGRGDSRNRDSYPDSYGDSRNGDSSRRREDSRDDLDSHRADGEYCAIETGHKRSRNSNYGQYEAGKMHRGKDFDPRPRRK